MILSNRMFVPLMYCNQVEVMTESVMLSNVLSWSEGFHFGQNGTRWRCVIGSWFTTYAHDSRRSRGGTPLGELFEIPYQSTRVELREWYQLNNSNSPTHLGTHRLPCLTITCLLLRKHVHVSWHRPSDVATNPELTVPTPTTDQWWTDEWWVDDPPRLWCT